MKIPRIEQARISLEQTAVRDRMSITKHKRLNAKQNFAGRFAKDYENDVSIRKSHMT